MIAELSWLAGADDVGAVVLTGRGEAWSAGMDLKEYFREVEAAPPHVEIQARRRRGASACGGTRGPS